jgi:hypothetical protein
MVLMVVKKALTPLSPLGTNPPSAITLSKCACACASIAAPDLRLINGIAMPIALMFYAGLCADFKYKLFPSDIITTE